MVDITRVEGKEFNEDVIELWVPEWVHDEVDAIWLTFFYLVAKRWGIKNEYFFNTNDYVYTLDDIKQAENVAQKLSIYSNWISIGVLSRDTSFYKWTNREFDWKLIEISKPRYQRLTVHLMSKLNGGEIISNEYDYDQHGYFPENDTTGIRGLRWMKAWFAGESRSHLVNSNRKRGFH